MGVRRAVEIALEATKNGRIVYSLGPLIHNRHAVEELRKRGVHVVEEDAIPAGPVVIRAHGVAPSVYARLRADGCEVIDATCPHVLASQRLLQEASKAGKEILLIGDPHHPEIQGLTGHAVTPVTIFQTLEEVEAYRPSGPFAVLAQTTFSSERYEEMIKVLRERFPDCEIHQTICDATELRQRETRELLEQADALIVVGGKESANTRRLYEIGRESGKPTFHIESAEELRWEDVFSFPIVAVTAGASTPDDVIERVIARLTEFLSERERHDCPIEKRLF